MSECSICHTKESRRWLGCLSSWILCDKCAKDYCDFKLQPESVNNLTILMETYFRRGKGENISYEQLHKEHSAFKFLTLWDLYELKGDKQ